MEQVDLYDAMFKRRSVRKFDAAPLDAETLAKVSAFLGTVRPMFPDIKTELKVLAGSDVKAGLTKAKMPHFVAAFSEKKPLARANVGFMLQQVDLFLSANGIGSLWQGNPTPAGKFSDLDFVIMIAFGKANEEVHRTSVAEFKREPLDKVSKAFGVDDLLEPARLAPSAMNGQPWLFTGDEKAIHFYCGQSAMFDKWNKIAIGVAACHAWIAAVHSGKSVEFIIDDRAEGETPKKYAYVVTMRIRPKVEDTIVGATKPDVSYSFEVQVGDTVAR